jgi:hypothetical protein
VSFSLSARPHPVRALDSNVRQEPITTLGALVSRYVVDDSPQQLASREVQKRKKSFRMGLKMDERASQLHQAYAWLYDEIVDFDQVEEAAGIIERAISNYMQLLDKFNERNRSNRHSPSKSGNCSPICSASSESSRGNSPIQSSCPSLWTHSDF